MAVNFVTVDRETPDMFPATVQEYLPQDHLARFVVEIVDQLDLRACEQIGLRSAKASETV